MLRAVLAALLLAASAVVAGRVEAQEAQQQPLVVYARSGGFIGVQDSMKIFRDGRVSSTNGDFRLSARRQAMLRARLRTARFPTLRHKYEADYPVSDGFVYTVSYAGKTVLVNEDAKVPLRLRRVLELLGEILVKRA